LYKSNKDQQFIKRHKSKMNDNDELILKKLEAMSLQISSGNSSKEMSIQTGEDNVEEERKKRKQWINNEIFLELPGNKIQTKRIDLRTNRKDEEEQHSNNKFDIFKEILQNTNDSPLETDMKSLHKMLNSKNDDEEEENIISDSSNTESSSEEDDNDGDSLWIGRYRRSKIEYLKQNK
jgi:hypothetical protein